MTWKTQSLFWLLACALALLLTGCRSAKLPRTLPVQGKVTWRGQPLSQGMVAFSPARLGEAGQPSRPAMGKIGPDGTYRLSSFRENDGAMPGEYRVTVVSYYASEPGPDDSFKPAVSRIPIRYGDPEKSGLNFTVPSDARGPVVYNIDVQGLPR